MQASIMAAVKYAPAERFGMQKSSSSAPSPYIADKFRPPVVLGFPRPGFFW